MLIVTEQKEILRGIHIPYFLSDASISMVKTVINTNYNFPWLNSPPSGPGPPHYRGFTITLRHTALGRTPLDEWSARRRELSIWQHTTFTRDIHDAGRIQNRHPSKRAASDPRLRARDHKL